MSVRTRGGAFFVVIALAVACGDSGPSPEPGADLRHPLASHVTKVRDRLTPLTVEDAEALNSFCRFSSPASSPYEVRRICGVVGRSIRGTDPERIAEFVIGVADHLYDDFFRTYEESELGELAAACIARDGIPELRRRRLDVIVGNYRGVFEGTFTQALDRVPFDEVIAPRPVPAQALVPGDDAGLDTFTGAAEVLRLAAFVADGGQPELAAGTYRRALGLWPDEPVLIAGLVSLWVEHEERFSDDLRHFLGKASKLDPGNGAWHYLRARRHFSAGRDEEGLAALREGLACPTVTFHTLARARRIAVFLEARGFGPIQSRLLAFRTVSPALTFELKLLADQTIRRSVEYFESAPEAFALVLGYPETLDRQLGAEPRMASLQELRWGILAIGLRRHGKATAHLYPERSRKCLERATTVTDRLAAVDRGLKICGGRDAWAVLCRRMGEERFLTWIDEVLYGDEVAFRLRCAEAGNLDAALSSD